MRKRLESKEDIQRALYATIGYGAQRKVARMVGVSDVSVCETISGRRANQDVLIAIANITKHTVRGVRPTHTNAR